MENSRLPTIEHGPAGDLALRTEDRALQAWPWHNFAGDVTPQIGITISGSGRRAWNEHMPLNMEQARTLAVWLIDHLRIVEPPAARVVPPRWRFWRRASEWRP
jgi:hypothetical protein